MKKKVGQPKKVNSYQINGIRLPLDVKEILERIAEEEYRSVNNTCSMIIQKWLRSEGFTE